MTRPASAGLPAAADEATARRIAARVERAVSAPVRIATDVAQVAASVGFAYATEGSDPDRVLAVADADMDRVKRGRKGAAEPPSPAAAGSS